MKKGRYPAGYRAAESNPRVSYCPGSQTNRQKLWRRWTDTWLYPGRCCLPKAVYDRYASRMLGVCYRYARNSADAEDILQDSFIKVLARSPSLNRRLFLKVGSAESLFTPPLKNIPSRYQKELRRGGGQESAESHSEPPAYNHLSEKRPVTDDQQPARWIPPDFQPVCHRRIPPWRDRGDARHNPNQSQPAGKARTMLQNKLLPCKK